jgi:hypothetical protein
VAVGISESEAEITVVAVGLVDDFSSGIFQFVCNFFDFLFGFCANRDDDFTRFSSVCRFGRDKPLKNFLPSRNLAN